MKQRPPQNHGDTPAFHVLFEDLFNPLLENLKKPTGAQVVRGRKAGPHAGLSQSPHEKRRAIIDRFFSRWRRDVGDDIYPVLRLILPEKDRDRAMYGLKEKILAKFLVKIMKIDKHSEDAYNLINWKHPGQNANATAGDFAARVYEVLSKRALHIKPGDMTVAEVNEELDTLAHEAREEKQLPILESFYRRMNAEEMMWIIRVILRNMRVGATEKTFLDMWHPDAEALFNVCSSLRRVCHQLYKPNFRLQREDRGVGLMQCYQPQLAYFNEKKSKSYSAMVGMMKTTPEDPEFWIEEKLDGERMQLHMMPDSSTAGGSQFRFWSRKAKDYTYLYGSGYEDDAAALTRHLKGAFADGVESIILDGEMITWDPELDAMVAFGSLKTAALAESRDPFAGGKRPFYRLFDILYLNGTDLTRYTLRDRRRALEASVKPIHRRMELLEYTVGKTEEDIEVKLQKVIEEASEGLVLKNPRSSYRLNDRHDDWVKVKPEYMQEFGESLDCLIIGGYYGSGHRGGGLSSFLCGLRDDRHSRSTKDGTKGEKFLSFFKVGGGMTRDDYAAIKHHTDGKWHDFDPKRPPVEYIELAGGSRMVERPDQWIKPSDSLVVEVKAASITESDEYATRMTLRFPRFKKFRQDKDWESALSVQELRDLKENVEEEHAVNQKKAAQEARGNRAPRGPGRSKKALTVAGYNTRSLREIETQQPKSNVFTGLNIFIMTEATKPYKKSKIELEELVKANGGRVVQGTDIKDEQNSDDTEKIRINLKVLCVAERRTVKVASLLKRGEVDVVRPAWLFDCIEQGRRDFAKGLDEMVLPFELERHLFFAPDAHREAYADNTDHYGDSFARDTSPEELKTIMANMDSIDDQYDEGIGRSVLETEDCRGAMFATCKFFFAAGGGPRPTKKDSDTSESAKRMAMFAGARIADDLDDLDVTHVIVQASSNIKGIRKAVSTRRPIPRVVTEDWVGKCWQEETRIDEEKYTPSGP